MHQKEKRDLIVDWQKYFRALRTLDCQWTMKGNFPYKPRVQRTIRYSFLWDGKQFRIDAAFSSTKPETNHYTSTIHTFDGKLYRDLETTVSGGRVFSLYHRPTSPRSPYGTSSLPVLDAFGFVFEENDPVTMKTLQGDDIWRRFERRITSITRGMWKGQHGRWLSVKGNPQYQKRKRVFVADRSDFPLVTMATMRVQLPRKSGYRDNTYESQVTRTMTWRSGSSVFVFPLGIATRGWSKEVSERGTKHIYTRLVNEVTAPVRINQSLSANRWHFDIPDETLVVLVPHPDSNADDLIEFTYDAKGGSLWAQRERELERIAERRRRIAAMPKIYDEQADGRAQVATALAEAKSQNKRVLLLFGANWCGPCHPLHNALRQNTETSTLLNESFIVVNVDVNKGHNQSLVKKYAGLGQGAIPFLVVLDIDGNRLAAPATEAFGSSDAEEAGFDLKKLVSFLSQWAPPK